MKWPWSRKQSNAVAPVTDVVVETKTAKVVVDRSVEFVGNGAPAISNVPVLEITKGGKTAQYISGKALAAVSQDRDFFAQLAGVHLQSAESHAAVSAQRAKTIEKHEETIAVHEATISSIADPLTAAVEAY